MSYTVSFSDPAKSGSPIIIQDGTKDTNSTSLSLVGKNYPGYGQVIAEDFVHLLENFSSSSPPLNPIEGQLWFDTSDPNSKKLRINDGGISGSKWKPINGVFQQAVQPTNATNGDIWVDIGSQQLKIFNGSSFVLVGPTYSSTTKTGSYATSVSDISGVSHNVIINYVNDIAVSIVASEQFTPNPVIYGFTTIYAGTNVASTNIGTLSNPVYAKMNGPAQSAYNLEVLMPYAQTVPADSFVRNDIAQTMHGTLSIVQDSGSLKLGADSTFTLQRKNQYNANFYNSFPDSGIFTFDLLSGGLNKTVLSIVGGTQRVGIDTTVPASSLDVNGTLNVTSQVTFGGTTDYTLSTPLQSSVNVAGGIHVTKSVGIDGTLYVNSGSIFVGPIVSTGIRPPIDNTYDIGVTTSAWRTVYGTTFQGGSGTGGLATFVGVASKANQLTTARNLTVSGNVASSVMSFNGTSDITFVTTAQTSIIYDRISTATATINDTVMIYRPSSLPDTGVGTLYKQSKAQYLKDINYFTPVSPPVTANSTPCGSLVPIGSVITYASSGAPPTPPAGWLLCDGTAYAPASYSELYSLIGTTYGTSGGNFRVPNLTPIASSGGGSVYYIIKY